MPERTCTIDDCTKPHSSRGMCRMHYNRWYHNGDPRWARPTPPERFWAKVDRTGECWLWTGYRNGWGYGVFSVDRVLILAHRWAYENTIGPIPEGLQIDHLCRVRACVNPDHLEPVTARENSLRSLSWSGVNAAKTHCAQGHPFDGANTYIRPSGGRTCRKCLSRWVREYKARKRATAQSVASS